MKTFIVAASWEDYDAAIAARHLDPGDCFYCLSLREAINDAVSNRLQGIPSRIVLSDAVKAMDDVVTPQERTAA